MPNYENNSELKETMQLVYRLKQQLKKEGIEIHLNGILRKISKGE